MLPRDVPTTGDLSLDDEARRLFFEIGIAGMVLGKKLEANLLFFNLIEADPQSAYPLLGVGYCRMMAGNFPEAHRFLSDPRVTNSELSRMGVALRGMAFHLEGKKEQMRDLLNTMDLSIEDSSSGVARALLDMS